MSKILISDKLAFAQQGNNKAFELNQKNQNIVIEENVKNIIKYYTNGSTNVVPSFLCYLVDEHPEFKSKLNVYRRFTKPGSTILDKKSLDAFVATIESQRLDSKLSVYRGTCKKLFSSIMLIDNDPTIKFEKIKVGSIIEPLTIQSTSLDPYIAYNFCTNGDDYLFIEYDLDEGNPALWVEPFNGYKEKEIILPPKGRYIIEEKTHLDLTLYDKIGKPSDINYIKAKRI